MKLKFNITIFLFLLSLIVTVFLFYYWSEAENRTSLFAFNLGYTLFLELVLYGYIYITRFNSKKIIGATYSILGTILFFYFLFGAISILSYNLLIIHLLSVKWYYTLIILGSLIAIIATGFTIKLNNNQVSQDERIDKTSNSLSNMLQELKYLDSSYISALSSKGIKETFESDYDSVIEKLINKINFINPKDFENDFTSSRISSQINTIGQHIAELKKPDSDGQSIHKNIVDCVDDTINFINSLK